MSFRSAFAPTLALVLAACGGAGSGSGSVLPPGSGESGSVVFEVTDAPIDPGLVESAVVEIAAVRLHREAQGESGFVTVFEPRTPVAFDLMRLRGGITQALPSSTLEPGAYRQARLVITDALLRLRNGQEYSTRAGTIDLGSQATSGYKIFFDPPLEITAGVEARALLDFQLPKTFSPVPANDMENAQSFHLHPLVRFAVLQHTGELRAVVSTDDGVGATLPVDGAAVYVLDPGETDLERALASSLSDASGSAVILGLPTGSYDVRAIHAGKSGMQADVVITRDSVTGVSISLE